MEEIPRSCVNRAQLDLTLEAGTQFGQGFFSHFEMFGFIDSQNFLERLFHANICHDLTHFRMKQSLREILNLLSAIVIVKLLIVNCYRLDLQRPDCQRSLSAYRKAWKALRRYFSEAVQYSAGFVPGLGCDWR